MNCPDCKQSLEKAKFEKVEIDRCPSCQAIWLDKGELEGILKKITRSPLSSLIDRFLSRREEVTQDQPSG